MKHRSERINDEHKRWEKQQITIITGKHQKLWTLLTQTKHLRSALSPRPPILMSAAVRGPHLVHDAFGNSCGLSPRVYSSGDRSPPTSAGLRRLAGTHSASLAPDFQQRLRSAQSHARHTTELTVEIDQNSARLRKRRTVSRPLATVLAD